MLDKFLKAALDLGADELEIAHKDGQETVCATRGPLGFSIGSIPSDTRESEALFDGIETLRRRKHISVDGTKWRVCVTDFDSFGQWAHRIKLTRATEPAPVPAPGTTHPAHPAHPAHPPHPHPPRQPKRRRRG